jgi:hexosaminidase
MYPIRRVYPHVGFRLLQAAFRAATDTETFSPQEFVVQYAAERFGLSVAQGRRLWSALVENSTVADATVDLRPLLRKAARAKRCLAELRPQRNQTEFAHLRLMADLRDHHLRFKRTERRIHSKAFHGRHIAAVLPQLRALLRESSRLDLRCRILLKNNLYPDELQVDLDYRSKKLRQLYARLARTGRPGKS